MKVLITAGPTYEPIDPVRFIGNRSSGKMGFALAEAFLAIDCGVTLISGPVGLALQHKNLNSIAVETANDMFEAVMKHTDYDIAIMAAAVADFTPKKVAAQKIKKQAGQDEMTIELVKTRDILASLGSIKKQNQFLVGFALETQNEEENAKKKLDKKKADLLVLNSLNNPGAGFGYNTNKATLFFKNKEQLDLPLMTKTDLAKKIAEVIVQSI